MSEEKWKVGAEVGIKVWETWLRMRKLKMGGGGGDFTSLTKMEWIMKGSSWEVRDDGGSFRTRKYESKEGMERGAPYGTAEEGPQ